MKKLMIMSIEDGKTSIQEATVNDIYENVNLLYKLAAKGKAIYKDLLAHKISEADNIIGVVSRTNNPQEASINLHDEFGIKKTTAEYILDLSLTELNNLTYSKIQDKLIYYTLAEKHLKELNRIS